jgi:2'-5' RNA ligase
MAAKAASRVKSGQEEELFFIAIIPDEPLRGRIMAIKQAMETTYKTRAALRSPPHITLHMPFRWPTGKIARLTTALHELTDNTSPFDVVLDGFGAFVPRVIFIKVAENEALNNLKAQVSKVSLQQWKLFERVDTRPFQPHITLAFRDLNKVRFSLAWEEYRQQEFQELFKANKLTLLKHNGNFWDEYMGFSFNS